MQFVWLKRVKRRVRRIKVRRRKRTVKATKHYLAHKEKARELVLARLAHWNQFYGYTYGRVAIRDQRSRWGSCSSKRNLNFNYRLVLIPIELVDYVIVHELCHLEHFNHSELFWDTVAKALPEYKKLKAELHTVSKNMHLYMDDTKPVPAEPTDARLIS